MSSSSVAPSAPITDFVTELDALAADAMSEWKIPGLAIAVVQNGGVALLKAYGLRDVEAQLPVTIDTHFMICSITKSFTSTGLALLKRFPPDLNRRDSLGVRNERVFG